MITPEQINRINELARKAKITPLTNEESIEQKTLRNAYLAAIRKNLQQTLDCITLTDQKDNHQ